MDLFTIVYFGSLGVAIAAPVVVCEYFRYKARKTEGEQDA